MQRFLRETMLAAGTISPDDLDLAFLTDDPTEGVEYIRKNIATKEALNEEIPDLY
jgi:predicted Rossmann-fold nucleotide-binding protein